MTRPVTILALSAIVASAPAVSMELNVRESLSPNDWNLVTEAWLKGLLIDERARQSIEGIGGLTPNNCSIEIGNVVGGNTALTPDLTIIALEPIINICQ